MNPMRALVTGGTGFVGSNLALRLHGAGHEVFITNTEGEQELPEFRDRSLGRDFATLPWETLGTMDVVFHQAAITDTRILDRDEMFRVNTDAALKLFRDAIAHGCTRIVYASSCATYGDVKPPFREEGPLRPLNPYGESKRALDERTMALAREYADITIVGLRYSNVYGPRENHKGPMASMVYQLAQQMIQGNPRLFKSGEQKRDYVFVGDVVQANLRAADVRGSGIYNCGSGVSTSFNEVVGMLNDVLATQRTPEYIDNPFAGRYQNVTQCDMTRARDVLGFTPKTDIRTGIRAYADSGHLVPKP